MERTKLTQIFTTCAALALSVATLSGCGSESAAPTKQTSAPTVTKSVDPAVSARAAVTYILDCVGEPIARPDSIVLTCADGNESLTGLAWSDWGADEATAVGKLETNTCEPSCAEGTIVTTPVQVRASEIIEGEASATYGKLRVTIQGAVPAEMQKTQTFPLQTVDPVDPAMGPGS